MFDENRVENNLIDKIKPTEKLIRKLAIKKKNQHEANYQQLSLELSLIKINFLYTLHLPIKI